MGFNVRNIIAGYTGGLVGGGKGPQTPANVSQVDTTAPTEADWNPVDSAKTSAAQYFANKGAANTERKAEDTNNITRESLTKQGLFDNDSTFGKAANEILSSANGGLQDKAVRGVISGLSGNGWKFGNYDLGGGSEGGMPSNMYDGITNLF